MNYLLQMIKLLPLALLSLLLSACLFHLPLQSHPPIKLVCSPSIEAQGMPQKLSREISQTFGFQSITIYLTCEEAPP